MKKILFLHGFFATGSCPMAMALKEAFEGQAIVLTPDLPLHPKEALTYIRTIIDKEKPDLLIGNSCGSFLAQILAPVVGIPTLLGNPYFKMTEFLSQRIGEHTYKAPRKDGNQRIVIDKELIGEFAELEEKQFDKLEEMQFDRYNPNIKDRVWGLFGEQDTLAHFEPLFLQHYSISHHFPGGHTPTEQEVKCWYVPLAQKMLDEFSSPTRVRIETYKSEYRNDFIRLNREWIESYFKIEASDIETFSHVDDIVEQGGQIFLAITDDGEVVGCCALKHHPEKQSYELAKMAVSPLHQGKHIGHQLGKAVMEYARKHGVKRIFLEGNTRLKASIALYRSLGFVEIPLQGNAYERCDILMEYKR